MKEDKATKQNKSTVKQRKPRQNIKTSKQITITTTCDIQLVFYGNLFTNADKALYTHY